MKGIKFNLLFKKLIKRYKVKENLANIVNDFKYHLQRVNSNESLLTIDTKICLLRFRIDMSKANIER